MSALYTVRLSRRQLGILQLAADFASIHKSNVRELFYDGEVGDCLDTFPHSDELDQIVDHIKNCIDEGEKLRSGPQDRIINFGGDDAANYQ